jgi:integrase
MLVPARDVARFIPHIFTVDEVRRALEAARALTPSFRGETFRVALLVLYCTGLRFGEAFRLRLQHVDLRARTFYVEDSKGRSRWVPFDGSLAREIRSYLKSRDAVSPRSPSSPIFLQPTGRPYSTKTASGIVRQVLRLAGLKPARGRVGPRPYDLRPTFAVHRLTRWYESGVAFEERLAWLSAYMGHDSLLGTQVYLHATSQLLQYASDRFARHFWHARCDT